MKTIRKLGLTCLCLTVLCVCTLLLKDKVHLRNDLIRLHVVANSDSEEDQAIKLQVRDSVVDYLYPAMQSLNNKEEAYRYIRDNLAQIEKTVNSKLDDLGVSDRAVVTLDQEQFSVRHYDTFSLPSGVYDALRVEIGDASGQNWWCVVFPSLCIPAAAPEFEDTAVSSGFDNGLVKTITRQNGYEIRFFLLDLIGKVENFFFKK